MLYRNDGPCALLKKVMVGFGTALESLPYIAKHKHSGSCNSQPDTSKCVDDMALSSIIMDLSCEWLLPSGYVDTWLQDTWNVCTELP